MCRLRNMCEDIYRELYKSTEHNRDSKKDSASLSVVYSLFKNDLIGICEARFLWRKYLTEGVLYVDEAIQMAESRRDMEDIKETEEALLYWLHGGSSFC